MGKKIKVVSIRTDSIIVMYGIQAFCIHDWGNRNYRWTLKKFLDDLNGRRTLELGELLTITKRNNLTLVSTRSKK